MCDLLQRNPFQPAIVYPNTEVKPYVNTSAQAKPGAWRCGGRPAYRCGLGAQPRGRKAASSIKGKVFQLPVGAWACHVAGGLLVEMWTWHSAKRAQGS
eukprot:1157364-Pelagomonas_calceolata.AAC.9